MYVHEYRVVCRIVTRLIFETPACFLRPCLRICIDLEHFSTVDYEIINIHIIFFTFLSEQFKCDPLSICRYVAVVRAKRRTVPGDLFIGFSHRYCPFVFARFACISGRGPLNYWKTDRTTYVSLSAVGFRWSSVWPALWKNGSTVGTHNERASTIIVYMIHCFKKTKQIDK